MNHPHVPDRTRRVLNVESRLNDDIATPVVMLAIAGVAADLGIAGVDGPGHAVVSLVVGVLVGAVLGGLGGRLTRPLGATAGCPTPWPGDPLGPLVGTLVAYYNTGLRVSKTWGRAGFTVSPSALRLTAAGRVSQLRWANSSGVGYRLAWVTSV